MDIIVLNNDLSLNFINEIKNVNKLIVIFDNKDISEAITKYNNNMNEVNDMMKGFTIRNLKELKENLNFFNSFLEEKKAEIENDQKELKEKQNNYETQKNYYNNLNEKYKEIEGSIENIKNVLNELNINKKFEKLSKKFKVDISIIYNNINESVNQEIIDLFFNDFDIYILTSKDTTKYIKELNKVYYCSYDNNLQINYKNYILGERLLKFFDIRFHLFKKEEEFILDPRYVNPNSFLYGSNKNEILITIEKKKKELLSKYEDDKKDDIKEILKYLNDLDLNNITLEELEQVKLNYYNKEILIQMEPFNNIKEISQNLVKRYNDEDISELFRGAFSYNFNELFELEVKCQNKNFKNLSLNEKLKLKEEIYYILPDYHPLKRLQNNIIKELIPNFN
jgi:hypothetical protein